MALNAIIVPLLTLPAAFTINNTLRIPVADGSNFPAHSIKYTPVLGATILDVLELVSCRLLVSHRSLLNVSVIHVLLIIVIAELL